MLSYGKTTTIQEDVWVNSTLPGHFPGFCCRLGVLSLSQEFCLTLLPPWKNRTKVCSVTDFQMTIFTKISSHHATIWGMHNIIMHYQWIQFGPIAYQCLWYPRTFLTEILQAPFLLVFRQTSCIYTSQTECVRIYLMVPPFPMVSPNCPAPCTVQRIGGSISVLALLPPPQPHQPHHHPPTGSQGCMGCGVM